MKKLKFPATYARIAAFVSKHALLNASLEIKSPADRKLGMLETQEISLIRIYTSKPELDLLAQDLKVWHTIRRNPHNLNGIIMFYGELVIHSKYSIQWYFFQ